MSHAHPLDAQAVRRARARVLPPRAAARLGGRLALLCEPTRLRALLALKEAGELCVGDLALALGVSEDAASYAMRRLRTAGLVDARREGRVVFYVLADDFRHELLSECLELAGGGTA